LSYLSLLLHDEKIKFKLKTRKKEVTSEKQILLRKMQPLFEGQVVGLFGCQCAFGSVENAALIIHFTDFIAYSIKLKLYLMV